MKKVLSFALTLVMCVPLLGGCGSSAPSEQPADTPAAESSAAEAPVANESGTVDSGTGGQTTLEYWTWFPSQDQYAETIAAFEAANPDIKINLTVMESKAFQEKTPMALSTGEDIDIVGVQPSAFATQVQDYLADLDPLMAQAVGADWKSKYSETALAQGNSLTNDATKLLTLTNSGSMVGFYNAALMKEIGAEVPTTLAEYKDVAAKLAAMYPDKYAGVFGGREAWIVDEMMLTVLGQKGDYYNQWRYNGANVDGEEFRTAINGFKKFFDEGVFSMDTMDLDAAGAMEAFVNGDALVFYMGSWEAYMLSQQLREGRSIALEDVGAMALPVVDAGDTLSVRSYIDSGIGIVDASEKKEAAAKFVAFVTLQEGADIFGKQLTGTSAKKDFAVDASLFASDTASQGWDTVVKLLAEGTADRNNVSGYSDVEGAAVQSVINGSLTTDQAVADLQAEWISGKY
ncbi:MAG: extracellular solute-binding protein [Clostridiales bacterium]|jgi:raffinose/stachyose/melibiose transport system substrate-binding protein|nr:extracellular solute-binding protein [Clostridiales bacterium]